MPSTKKKVWIYAVLLILLSCGFVDAEVIWDFPENFICDSPVHCYIIGEITTDKDTLATNKDLTVASPLITSSHGLYQDIKQVTEDVYGYKEKSYICTETVETSLTAEQTKRCVKEVITENGTSKISLFDRDYNNFDDKTSTFYYEDYEKIGTTIVDKPYLTDEKRFISGRGEVVRFDIAVPPNSAGKADLVLCNADVCSTLDPYFNSTWGYYREFNLTNDNTFDLEDWQVSVILNLSSIKSKAKDDCTDLRFVTENGGEWNESLYFAIDPIDGGCNIDGNTVFWLNVTLPASSNTTLRLYYNNSAATNGSDLNHTFAFHDQMNGVAMNTDLWSSLYSKGNGCTETVEAGAWNMTPGAATKDGCYRKTLKTFSQNINWRVESRLAYYWKTSSTDQTLNYFGMTNSTTAGNYGWPPTILGGSIVLSQNAAWTNSQLYTQLNGAVVDQDVLASPITVVEKDYYRLNYTAWNETTLWHSLNMTGVSEGSVDFNGTVRNQDFSIFFSMGEYNSIAGTWVLIDWVRAYKYANKTPTYTALGLEQTAILDTSLALYWNWTSINYTIYVPSTNICVNSSESMNCTLDFNGTYYPNLTVGTHICWSINFPHTGNFSAIVASCEDLAGNRNVTTNAWVEYAIYATNLDYYCPSFVGTDEIFTIWADYELANGSNILGATVNVSNMTDTYDLIYSSVYGYYKAEFLADSDEYVWRINISASKSGYQSQNASCTIRIVDSFNVTVRIWEEVEREVVANTSGEITVRNYDVEFIDPYINELAYILFVNLDVNDSDIYDECHLPFGSGEKLFSLLNFGNWLGNSTDTATDYVGDYIWCNRYWFRGEYTDGEATITLPWTGNYSILLVSGTMAFENSYSPPEIAHGGLSIPFGDIEFDTKDDMLVELYIPHSELNWWSALSDTIFAFMVTILPILLLVFLLLMGVGVKTSLSIAIAMPLIFTFLRMFGLF